MVLNLAEAGGYAALSEGRPYRPLEASSGLLVAANKAVWDLGHTIVLG